MSLFWKPSSSSALDGDPTGRGRGNHHDDAATDASVLYAYRYANTNTGSGIGRGNAMAQQQQVQQQRLSLPIYKHKNQILYAVEHYDLVVIVGETGCGKSTQLPQYLVSNGWASNDFCILCTQPRRIAAITLAQRVASEMQTPLGRGVGYAVRFQQCYTPFATRIKYATDGMLLREATVRDPLLSNYSVVIVDEAHERTLNSDAVLGLLQKIKRRKRPDLRIIVTSATIDAQAFVDFFEKGLGAKQNFKSTIISVDGRQYPVDVLYVKEPVPNYIHGVVETAYKIHNYESKPLANNSGGDILCFLPSGEDVDVAIQLAEEEYFHNDTDTVEFLPLYGALPYRLQARIFDTASSISTAVTTTTKGGKQQQQQQRVIRRKRRIIFTTNIAETSVTVPNVSYVVDSGLVKLPYFDPETGLERLIVTTTSRASARQRSGRAGRLRAGKCYRLYTEHFYNTKMQSHTPPEILRTNVTSFILTLKALGVDNILAFDLMDVPSIASLSHGLESLYALGAMDERTNLTDLGRDMSRFPIDPRTSKMLFESLTAGCSWEMLGVASALQVDRDLFYKPRSRSNQQNQQQWLDYEAAMSEIVDPNSDHVTYANLFAEMDDQELDEHDCSERFINYTALKRAMEIRKQLASILRQFGKIESLGGIAYHDGTGEARSKMIRRCVTAGYFMNIAKLANDGRYYTLGHKQVLVIPSSSSVLASSTTSAATSAVSEYIVFGETFDGPRGGIELKSVSNIEARWLRELASNYWS